MSAGTSVRVMWGFGAGGVAEQPARTSAAPAIWMRMSRITASTGFG